MRTFKDEGATQAHRTTPQIYSKVFLHQILATVLMFY